LKIGGGGCGARKNLKVGGTGKSLVFFGSTCTFSRFGERFRDGQYSLVSLLFAVLLLTVPPPLGQPFVKVGARAVLCPMESVPLELYSRGWVGPRL